MKIRDCVIAAVLAGSWAGTASAAATVTFAEGSGEVIDGFWLEAGSLSKAISRIDGTEHPVDITGGAFNLDGFDYLYFDPVSNRGHLFGFDVYAAAPTDIFFTDVADPDHLFGWGYHVLAGHTTIDVTTDFYQGYYLSGKIRFVSLDAVDYSIDNIVFDATPEPGTWALLIAGFGMVGAALRRRRAFA